MSADQVGRFRRGCSRNGQLNSSPSHSQLQFQDSALSPTLALLPANRAGEASVAEYSFFQKSDAEFLPLSASLDFSAGHESDEGSLSQHPLAQEVDASSVSCGPRSTRPDGASELLYRQLLARTNKSAPATSSGQKCVPASASRGAEEASFLGFLPQSQSTPGLREPPSESAVVPSSDHESKKVRDGNALPDSNASLLAESSVITSDVDNDAPRWTSKDQRADLNIEERIPLYLQNLGIDRSPADILTPFGPRGPIREPEFSPTDLSTVKDSVGGTPAKLSEDGSPPKGDLADSGASFPSGQESLAGAARGRSATSSASSADAGRPPALPNSRSADVSSPRARSSLFAVQSLSGSATGAGGSARLVAANSSPELSVEIQDTASPRRVEPEGCSAAPRSPIAVGPPPEPAPDEEVSLPDGTAPIREDPEDRSAMSDGSGQSSLTVRVAELLRGGSPASGLSDRDDPEHKRRFILKLSEGRFDSLELGEEDRRRIEEIKAAMLSNNFVTSESSTDTESTAMAAAAAQPVSDPGGARTPVLPGPERTHPEDREFAGGADVKAHTTRMRPASASSLTPDPLPPTQLDAGFVHKKTTSSSSSSEGAGGSESAAEADSAAGPGRTHVAEDTTIPFAQVSRAHLGLSPKPPEGAPRPPTSSSSSSSSRSRPTAEFVPLRRSSPAPGVGRSGPPPRWDGRRGLASALAPPPPPPHPHHSVAGGSMRSSTPETPVRDECAPRAAPLRPYKPRGAGELFFVPHAEADASSSCTTMESSHTGLDDAVPPPFPAEVLGRTDPGLDRGVFIKHAEGIYSKKRANAHSGGAVMADGRLPPAAAERLVPGGGVARPPSDREAWLLEQLHRLSELVLATGGAAEPPTSRGQTQSSAGAAACVLCPADRDESSATSSTLDTDRLVRAFGARRVLSAKTPASKSAARLRKLYGEVAKQRAQWEGRSFRPAPPSDSAVTEPSDATVSSSSSPPSSVTPPWPRNAERPLSRGLQAVDVEIVSNATRLGTRDVGTMFPPAGQATKGHATPLKYRKTRAPAKLPKAVWWFVPWDDDDSKENRPDGGEAALEEADGPGTGTVWYDAVAAREPLGQRQMDDDDDDGVYPASSSRVASLQEALATRRADFISSSRRRLQILRVRKTNGGAPPGGAVPGRAVPWKEMIQRTNRMYERLPEVLRKLEAERREAQNRLNRLNLQIYNKRLTQRRLDKRNTKLW